METRRLLKQRLAVFLSIAMALTMLLGSTPQMQTTAEAATTNTKIYAISGLSYVTSNNEQVIYFQVEAKQKVSLGYLFYVYKKAFAYQQEYLADLKNVSYTLKKTSVATIDKKGVLSTKSEGVVQGTIKYKGEHQRFAVQIVKAGKLGTNSSRYNKIRNIVNKIKKFDRKITAKNCYQYRKLNAQLERVLIGMNSFGITTMYANGNETFNIDNLTISTFGIAALVLPMMVGYGDGDRLIRDYAYNNNPVGTLSGKTFKVKSVSAKKNTKNVTFTLNKKVTALQIFAIKSYYSKDTEIKNDKTAMFSFYMRDKKSGYTYHGIAVAREGSKEIKATMTYMRFKSGHKYQPVSAEREGIDWTGNKIVKLR